MLEGTHWWAASVWCAFYTVLCSVLSEWALPCFIQVLVIIPVRDGCECFCVSACLSKLMNDLNSGVQALSFFPVYCYSIGGQMLPSWVYILNSSLYLSHNSGLPQPSAWLTLETWYSVAGNLCIGSRMKHLYKRRVATRTKARTLRKGCVAVESARIPVGI